MFGIYIHIPFCRHQCPFCDFAVTTRDPKQFAQRYSQQLIAEIHGQAPFWDHHTSIDTVFFGGGTPSLLDPQHLKAILTTMQSYFPLSPDVEISLECNPEDVTLPRVQDWLSIGINRFSLGVQSFHDTELSALGRKHRNKDNVHAIDCFEKGGVQNFSLDLMFGLPNQTLSLWQQSLEKAFQTKASHISTYELTIEPQTVFEKWVRQKKIVLPLEENMAAMYFLAKSLLQNHGFAPYEISNACKPSKMAKHNLACWNGHAYWGLGLSAHSRWIKGKEVFRIQNTKHFGAYLNEELKTQKHWIPQTNLSYMEECILTGLRLESGIPIIKIDDYLREMPGFVQKNYSQALDKGLLVAQQDHICIPPDLRIHTDTIAFDLLCP